jgi:hypothetical protein
MSRSFVRTALERPPTGFEEEIRYLYIERGRLQSVVAHAKRLISEGELASQSSHGQPNIEEEEESADMWNADAIGSLTIGAILTLKVSLQGLGLGVVAALIIANCYCIGENNVRSDRRTGCLTVRRACFTVITRIMIIYCYAITHPVSNTLILASHTWLRWVWDAACRHTHTAVRSTISVVTTCPAPSFSQTSITPPSPPSITCRLISSICCFP